MSSKGAPVVLLLIETLNECFLEAQQLLNEEVTFYDPPQSGLGSNPGVVGLFPGTE